MAGETLNLNAVSAWSPSHARRYEWRRDGVPVRGNPNTSNLQLPNATLADGGRYTVVFSNDYGSTESEPFEVRVIDGRVAPVIVAPAEALEVDAGGSVTLRAPVRSFGRPTYRWRLDGREIESGAIASDDQFVLHRAHAGAAGLYTVAVSNGAGTTTADVARVTVRAVPAVSSARLVNVSTRARAGRDDQTLIVGFVLAGPDAKRVLLRSIGSGLRGYLGDAAAANARLRLFADETLLAENDDWARQPGAGALAVLQDNTGAFLLDARGDDAALDRTLAPGAYTIHLNAADAGRGVGLLEVYDGDPGQSATRIVNLSTRASVGAGDEVAIPGFVVRGYSPRNYLIRAVGPGARGPGGRRRARRSGPAAQRPLPQRLGGQR